jgi:hypothetical protein
VEFCVCGRIDFLLIYVMIIRFSYQIRFLNTHQQTTIINSKIYCCQLPNTLNRMNNNLLDVCGNMKH